MVDHRLVRGRIAYPDVELQSAPNPGPSMIFQECVDLPCYWDHHGLDVPAVEYLLPGIIKSTRFNLGLLDILARPCLRDRMLLPNDNPAKNIVSVVCEQSVFFGREAPDQVTRIITAVEEPFRQPGTDDEVDRALGVGFTLV